MTQETSETCAICSSAISVSKSKSEITIDMGGILLSRDQICDECYYDAEGQFIPHELIQSPWNIETAKNLYFKLIMAGKNREEISSTFNMYYWFFLG